MKYSGIKWIGEIPDNWNVRKVKQCFYISKEQAHEENPIILSLARAGVKVRDISNNEGQLAASYDNYNPVMPGDLLLNPMDLYSGANCSLSEVSGVISPAYINLRKKVELNPKFYDYYFKTQYWAMAMFAHGKGVSFDNRWTMNAETLLNYYLPFTSSDVQDKIVDLINKKTAEIDSLIEIENQQIEKLKEYKQAVITEAVTKGLDKNLAMKDSGIEWIGKIPEGWNTIKIKFTSWLKGRIGWDGLKSGEFIEEGPYLITGTDFIDGGINWDTCVHISEERFMEDETTNMELTLKINDIEVDVIWTDNDSVRALKNLAKDGLTINMSKYGGFEQVGSIGSTLPSADTRITTNPGDIVLYSSNQIVLFYDSNTWSYTKLGHINLSKSELSDLLGDEDVVITLILK